MSTLTPSDNQLKAEDRITPDEARVYRIALTAETNKSYQLDYDLKYCTIKCDTAMDFNGSYYNGSTESPDDLTAGSDTRLQPYTTANEAYPLLQNKEFNRLHFKFASAYTGTIYVFAGGGKANGETAGAV